MILRIFPSIEHPFPSINPTIASRRVQRVLAGQSFQPFRPAVSRLSLMPRRKGAKGAKGELPREVEVSKAMSLTLRHRAVADGLKVDKNGYVNVADLVSLISFERLNHSSAIHSAQSLFRLNISYNTLRIVTPHISYLYENFHPGLISLPCVTDTTRRDLRGKQIDALVEPKKEIF